jgi:hypothetical protein
MRPLVLLGLAVLAGCGGPGSLSPSAPPATTTDGGGLRAVELARGLDRPIYVAAAPGEPDRLYVVGQAGAVLVVEGGRVLTEPFLDISGLVLTAPKGEFASERGLLSIAFAPDYATSGRLYVDYTDRNGDVNVVEYRARDGRADPASARRHLLVEKESERHHGGQIAFGPDGRLYAGVGDDAASQIHPQRLEPGDFLGKILALEPDGGWQVVAYGLRNPWRFSFDRETGDLWVGDVGENRWEEVSRVPAGSGLANLGWDGYEGFERVVWDEGGHNEPRGPGELVWPAAVYGHEAGCAVVGGYVYRGSEIEAARGRYVYADYCQGLVWSVDPARPADVRLELDLPRTIASFGEDAEGELYIVSRSGVIYRLAD